MKGHPRISPIYRLAQPDTPDPDRHFARIWRWCRDLWVQNGTIVAKPAELPENIRASMIQWANDTYGEHRNGKKRRRP
jgi:hypothetical protein